MGGKKKAGTEVLACRKLDEEKSNSSEAGDESPVLKVIFEYIIILFLYY